MSLKNSTAAQQKGNSSGSLGCEPRLIAQGGALLHEPGELRPCLETNPCLPSPKDPEVLENKQSCPQACVAAGKTSTNYNTSHQQPDL